MLQGDDGEQVAELEHGPEEEDVAERLAGHRIRRPDELEVSV